MRHIYAAMPPRKGITKQLFLDGKHLVVVDIANHVVIYQSLVLLECIGQGLFAQAVNHTGDTCGDAENLINSPFRE